MIEKPIRVDYRSSSLLDWILHKSGKNNEGWCDVWLFKQSLYYIFVSGKLKFPPKYITFRRGKSINFGSFIDDLIAISWERFQLILCAENAWIFFYSACTNVID